MYVGTRADNVAEACEIIGRELVSLRDEGVTAEELDARQGARQGPHGPRPRGDRRADGRLARGVLFDVPLLSLDEMLERVDAVDADEVAELAAELYDPAGLAAACVGRDEELLPQPPPARVSRGARRL